MGLELLTEISNLKLFFFSTKVQNNRSSNKVQKIQKLK